MIEGNKKINRPLVYAILGVTLLVLAVSGSAYAYFTASANNNNKDDISGRTLDVKLSVGNLEKVGAGTGDLIPIYDGTITGKDTQLTKAVTSAKVTAKTDCIDNKGYTVCHVYALTINNTGTNDTKITTEITVSGSTNIKWAKMTDRNTPASGTGNVNLNTGTLATDVALNKNSAVTQYFMVYLKNTGDDQTNPDAGKEYTGTVTVRASTGTNIEATF